MLDEDDDEESSFDENQRKKGKNNTDKKTQLQKWEKNVRRRVYDALNVLYAAEVLRKDGKHVYCDTKAMQLQIKMKE